MNTTTNKATTPTLIQEGSQVTSKDVRYTEKEVQEFCKAITDRVREKVKSLTKNKPWVDIRQDNDRIVANICGPLRKTKTETGDKFGPLFSISIPLFSSKVLGPMLPYNGHNNHWANKDFLKRLHLVSGALLEELEAAEKKESK